MDNYQKVLNIVFEFCVINNISFKYIYKENDIRYCISGESPIEHLGKFITIYPNHKNEFKKIIYSLYNKLIGFEGPYILSDKRYKNSNIYYRYGIIESSSDYLLTPEGKEIVDERKYFFIPDFEEDPFKGENHDVHDTKFIEK